MNRDQRSSAARELGKDADLIFVSLEDWDEVWRRNQFVCAELARRFPDMRILFVGLPRNISNSLRHGRLHELRRRATYQADGLQNVTITHALKFLPDSLPVALAVNEAMFRRHVRAVAKSLGMRRPVLWLNPHSAVHMVGRMGEAAVVYDVTDDWTSFAQSPGVLRRTVRQDAELCRRADAVIVCSQRLYDMKQHQTRCLHLIENGVHAEHYAGVLGDGPVPEESRRWAKPVFGYTGTIHSERVDVAMVDALASRLRTGSLVFVGPNHLPAADRLRLTVRGNVHFTGPVAYAQLPMYMRAIDVCIVPHRMSAFTESLNPIKLWEYLAAGKPIVATDVPGFREFSELVRIARTPADFLAAMQAASVEGDRLTDARRTVARRHSWQRRVDDILDVIHECLGHRGAVAGMAQENEVCLA